MKIKEMSLLIFMYSIFKTDKLVSQSHSFSISIIESMPVTAKFLFWN